MDIIKKEDTFNIAITDIENQRRMCEVLLKTPHYSKLGTEGIYAIVAKARSLDMDPIEALNGALYYVNGRVGMSTEAMAARMRAFGHSIQKDPRSTPTCCILIGKRADNGDTWITSFSVEDAKRAGIYNERGPWGKYPSVMCYNRAMSMMYRQLTPDLSKGVGYTLDELKEISISDNSSYQKNEEEVVPEKIETISRDQANELIIIFTECDPNYIEKVWQTLRKPPISVETIEQLPSTLYDRIKNASLKNRDEFRSKIEKEHTFDSEEISESVMEA
jgi:hypothetical protein